jgi:hypothetical protein
MDIFAVLYLCSDCLLFCTVLLTTQPTHYVTIPSLLDVGVVEIGELAVRDDEDALSEVAEVGEVLGGLVFENSLI